MDRHNVSVQEPLLAGCYWPFLFENFQKPLQGLNDEGKNHCSALLDIISVFHTLGVAIVQQHLLLAADKDMGLNGAKLAL